MARRGENIFRRKDGRWEARVFEHRENGNKIYRSLYGKSYTEVKAKKEEYYGTVYQVATPAAKKLATFAHLAECWLSAVRGTVKESSYTRYYRNVHSYLVPAIGKYAISGIDSALVGCMKDEMLSHGGKRGKGLSEKTVSDIFSTLKMILLHASEQGYSAMNIAFIHSPRRKKKEPTVIPKDKLELLEEALLNSDEPKTDTSRRDIPLPRALCRYLKEHCKEGGNYLLTGTDKPSEPHTLYIRYERFLKRNGFGQYTFHALRHTFATRGIESGFDTKSLSEILGHSDVTTTLRCYVHPSMEQKRKQMENMFGTKIRGQKYSL